MSDGRGSLLVTGGARSGKSRYALARAVALPPPRVFIATAEPGDAEMRARIGVQSAGSSQARGVQQITASGLPQVERAAQRTTLRWASPRQPDRRSALR